MKLENKAIFIADAHENSQRKGFLEFLRAVDSGEITTPQLIIMGDMFDMLVGEISATHEFATPYIILLEKLANKGIEVLYIEGNHDFNVKRFFHQVKVYPLQKQPLTLQNLQKITIKRAKFGTKGLEFVGKGIEFKDLSSVVLAHGDIFLPPFLALALKSLRISFLLRGLNIIDKIFKNKLSAHIVANQKKKNLFYQITDFNALAQQRYAQYGVDRALIIEGHYHQNVIINTKECKYINLPTFAYERSFFVVECE